MKKFLLLSLVITSLLGCENDSEEVTSGKVTEYFPMKIGNYWVYEHYRVDMFGNKTKLPLVDSVVVTNDTLINGKTYYVFEGTDYFRHGTEWGITGIYRDSSDCIVNPKGEIKLSLSNFSDTLHQAVLEYDSQEYAEIIYKMQDKKKKIEVPAGTFDALNFQGKFIANENFIPSGVENPRYLNNYYSKGVGLVSKNYFYFTGEHVFEVKLSKYGSSNPT